MLDIVASYHCMQFPGKQMNQAWENSNKPSFGPDFGTFGPNLGHHLFFSFSKIWLPQSLDNMVSYHHVQYQKKTNDPIWWKLSDGRKDGQTDESGFIGRCPTNVEHLI